MKLYPNCKLNIGLAVTHKREDGYHDLDTIFYPVYGLHDILDVEPIEGNDIVFEQDGIVVDCAAEDNLIVRCYRLMKAAYPQIGGVRVRFTKQIPFGAGLGGGSADATFMAKALNELFGLLLTEDELARLVKPLGADCPFFAYNRPCHATGIGDVLTPLDKVEKLNAEKLNVSFVESLRGKRLILVKPDTAVSTKEAYGGIVPRDRQENPTTDLLVNDFEVTVFVHHPELAAIKQALLSAGAIYAAMSGSGSTIFGFYEPDRDVRLPEEINKYVIYNEIVR